MLYREDKSIPEKIVSSTDSVVKPVCCFYMARGICKDPRPPCRFRHAVDDGQTLCSFGATCKLGHARRVLGDDLLKQQQYWHSFRSNGSYEGANPAARDATLLRSQLEPWPTAVLRSRLIKDFGVVEAEAQHSSRADVMARLLAAYQAAALEAPPRYRKTIQVAGNPVRDELCKQLLEQLQMWAVEHTGYWA